MATAHDWHDSDTKVWGCMLSYLQKCLSKFQEEKYSRIRLDWKTTNISKFCRVQASYIKQNTDGFHMHSCLSRLDLHVKHNIFGQLHSHAVPSDMRQTWTWSLQGYTSCLTAWFFEESGQTLIIFWLGDSFENHSNFSFNSLPNSTSCPWFFSQSQHFILLDS